jgi:hypothetical protein
LAVSQWLDGRHVDVKLAVPGDQVHFLAGVQGKEARRSNKLFVGGLPQDTTTDELRSYFSRYGVIADAVVMVDRKTSRSRGFGFVRFIGAIEGCFACEAALMDFANHQIGGKWIEVKRATPGVQSGQDTAATSPASCSTMSGTDYEGGGDLCVCGGDGSFGLCMCQGSLSPLSMTSTASTLSISHDFHVTAHDSAAARRGHYEGRRNKLSSNISPCNGFVTGAEDGSNSECDGLLIPQPLGVLSPRHLGSHGFSRAKEASWACGGSQNDPAIANTTPEMPPGLASGMPMKITCRDVQPSIDDFTREDFLSLEVRTTLAW